MRNLICQYCKRTYEEVMKHNIGFYCDSDGNQLCFVCKDIHEKYDTGLVELIKFKDKWQKLKNFIKSEEIKNKSQGETFSSMEDRNILRVMEEFEKEGN